MSVQYDDYMHKQPERRSPLLGCSLGCEMWDITVKFSMDVMQPTTNRVYIFVLRELWVLLALLSGVYACARDHLRFHNDIQNLIAVKSRHNVRPRPGTDADALRTPTGETVHADVDQAGVDILQFLEVDLRR